MLLVAGSTLRQMSSGGMGGMGVASVCAGCTFQPPPPSGQMIVDQRWNIIALQPSWSTSWPDVGSVVADSWRERPGTFPPPPAGCTARGGRASIDPPDRTGGQ